MSVPVYRARRTRTRGNGSPVRKTVFIVLIVLAVLIVGAGVAGALTMNSWLDDLPDYKAEGAFDVSQPTTIYSADGVLLARLYLQNRESVGLDQMSPNLVKAIVAVEDERFYEHNGVDFIGLARAVYENLRGRPEGASTLTQQYVRNTILLDERTAMSLERKVREAYLAMELEKMYSKDEILEMYLNTVYFGEGAYGAEAAAKTFCAKSSAELTISEAALLAGIVQRPSALSPFDNLEAATERRNLVLRRMLANEAITQAEYDEALATVITPMSIENPDNGIYQAHYFVAEVKRQLQQQFSSATVFSGGLTVTTTLDTRMQAAAETAVWNKIGAEGPEGALVSIEPKTGYVRAVVGGRNYAARQFSMATQAHRQPGSSFKTFTLVAALGEGISPTTKIDSSSPANIKTASGTWSPSNSEGQGRGMMTLSSATAGSVNTVFARLAEAIGADKIVSVANAMGIKTELKPYLSITLGAQNVTPLEMASAYATLANSGTYVAPAFYTEVKDRKGDVIYTHEIAGVEAISPEVAYATTQVLRSVVTGGTGTRAALGSQPVAGKTGTSQNNRDVWFAGYTPQLSTVVWVGYPEEQEIFINGSRAYGGTVCAPIFAAFMKEALKDAPVEQFATADSPIYNSQHKFAAPHVDEAAIVGQQYSAIVAANTLAGWEVSVQEVFAPEAPGTIITMTVNSTAGTVLLTVSKGPEPVVAPPTPTPVDPMPVDPKPIDPTVPTEEPH